MSDNTDEEYLEIPTNIQSENLSDMITPTTDTETINPNQETENMEVHKHPHHVTHKKKWSEYFLEFLMLFLAVFLGFLAENIREDSVERHREKQYIVSLVHDLENDTLQFGIAQNRTKKSLPAFDSIRSFFKNPKAFNNKLPFRFMGKFGSGAYIPTEPTIQQLKNTGSLRLIENRKVLDSILIYDSYINNTYRNQANLLQVGYNDFLHQKGRVFDGSNSSRYFDDISNGTVDTTKDYDMILDSDNKSDIKDIVNTFGTLKVSKIFYIEVLKEIKKEATDLILFIKKEYNLK